jgi:hypothetical protein
MKEIFEPFDIVLIIFLIVGAAFAFAYWIINRKND